MPNLLTITKKPNGYYDFVVNGNVADIVTNDRNDMTGVGIYCHFKTANGSSIIKEQNISFGNVTLIDGVALPAASSMDDLIDKLASIDFYAWRDATGSGSSTYEGLTDTTAFFGNQGRVPVVNTAENQLLYTDLPDTSKLDAFPAFLIAGKMLQVNPTADGYIFVDPPAGSNGYTQPFVYASGAQEFTLASSAKVSSVFYNGGFIDPVDYTVVGNLLTILPTYTLAAGDRIIVTGVI